MLHLDRHTLSLAVTQPCEQADNFEVCLCIYVVPTTCTCPMQPVPCSSHADEVKHQGQECPSVPFTQMHSYWP